MDHPEPREGLPPGGEHGLRQRIALGQRMLGEAEDLLAVQPVHGEEPAGGEVGMGAGHADLGLVLQDMGIERGVLGLAAIIQLLAYPLADLAGNLAGVDGTIHAAMDGEEHVELGEVCLHRRLHVRILELAGHVLAVQRHRLVHLPEGGGGGGLVREGCEPRLPVAA